MPVDDQRVFQADRYAIHRVRFPGGDGHLRSRDIIRHPGAVVILPILPDGRIVMIRNYRPSIEKTLLEIPAGTMEPGEPPLQTAHRELAEETGYRAGRMEPVRSFYASPGICDETMHLFVASELTEGVAHRELYERIQNRIATGDEIRRWIDDGTIEDGKTLLALLDFLRRGSASPPGASATGDAGA